QACCSPPAGASYSEESVEGVLAMSAGDGENGNQVTSLPHGETRVAGENSVTLRRCEERDFRKPRWPSWCGLLFCAVVGIGLAHFFLAVSAGHFNEIKNYPHHHWLNVSIRPLEFVVFRVECQDGPQASQLASDGRIILTAIGAFVGA